MTTKNIHFVFILKTVFTISFLLITVCGHAQGVAINNLGNNPDNSAILDVNSSEKGFLIPRLSTTERNAITVPASSLLIYNTTTKCFEFYENGGWHAMGCACVNPPAQPSPISGNNNVCQGDASLTYSVNYMQGVTYNWSYSGTGLTINSGQGTNIINVSYDGTATGGTLMATPANACGTGTAQDMLINVSPSSAGGTVTAVPPANVCEGNIVQFSHTGGSGTFQHFEYQWNGTGGAWTTPWSTNNPLDWNSVANGTLYVRAEVKSGVCPSAYSAPVSVTVNTAPGTPTAGTHIPDVYQIQFNWNTVGGATGYRFSGVNDYNSAFDNGTSTTFTWGSLNCETSYTLYVWAYNDCGPSSVLTLNSSTTTCPFVCGTSTVTFTYKGASVTYGTISSAGGRCWLDRNLGASQVATSRDDVNAYGDWFQWGRADEGHQTRTSGTTTTRATHWDPNTAGAWNGKFVTTSANPRNWLNYNETGLWQQNGVNNPCPAGWRVPSQAEWDTEAASWSPQNRDGAFNSLKLTVGGQRRAAGTTLNVGTTGYYWTSTPEFTDRAKRLIIDIIKATTTDENDVRSAGMSVRCIKD